MLGQPVTAYSDARPTYVEAVSGWLPFTKPIQDALEGCAFTAADLQNRHLTRRIWLEALHRLLTPSLVTVGVRLGVFDVCTCLKVIGKQNAKRFVLGRLFKFTDTFCRIPARSKVRPNIVDELAKVHEDNRFDASSLRGLAMSSHWTGAPLWMLRTADAPTTSRRCLGARPWPGRIAMRSQRPSRRRDGCS